MLNLIWIYYAKKLYYGIEKLENDKYNAYITTTIMFEWNQGVRKCLQFPTLFRRNCLEWRSRLLHGMWISKQVFCYRADGKEDEIKS